MRKRIYVAGPISKGDVQANVMAGIAAGHDLIQAGFAVYVPHYSQFVDPGARPGTESYECWLENDLAWIRVSDAVLRLPGESLGADREVAFATLNSVPVLYSLADVEAYFADV